MRKQAIKVLVSLAAGVLFGVSAGAQLPEKVGDTPVPSLAPIVKKASPAVVNIATRGTLREQRRNPLLEDPFFRRFFDAPELAPRERQFQSAGSGVIVDSRNGYIITNAHVVENADEITVTLLDDRQIKAKVIGSDKPSDVALLKITANNLIEMPLADSSRAEVGDFVMAIGNPFGIGQTATSGIVSALGRSGLSVEGYEHFIQTDAPINPGNSGGALINLKGELIGINSAIIGPAGGNVGIGFAVPSVMAHAVMEQLVRFGEVRRGRLGIAMSNATGVDGAQIAEVEANSPASAAGLRKGDIVTALNGHPVRGSAELRARLGVVPAGETVELKVQRGTQTQIVKARIAEIEKAQAGTGQSVPELAGAALVEVERKGLPGKNRAVGVSGVESGSRAFSHGIRPGDLIIGVNERRVSSVAELGKALRAQGRLVLNVVRGDFLLTIQLR